MKKFKIKILVAILAVLLMTLQVYANCPYLPSSGTMSCMVPAFLPDLPWIVYAVFGIIIAFLIVGIAYMLSSALNSSDMKAWASNEFWQAITTALIVFFLLLLSFIENQTIPAFGYSNQISQVARGAAAEGVDTSPIVAGEVPPSSPVLANAYLFLRRSWCYVGGTTLTAMVGYSEFVSILRKVEVIFEKPKGGFGFSIYFTKGISEFINGTFGKMFGFITDPLMAVTGVVTAQMFLLCLIDYLGMTLFLPLGIVLRSIPLTRGFGTALLALVIGLYLVYPLSVLMGEKVVFAMNPDNIPGGATSQNWWRNYVPADVAVYLGISAVSSAGQMINSASRLANITLPPTLTNLFVTINIGTLIFAIFDSFRIAILLASRAAFVIVIFGAFLPFLSIVVTFGITREVARVLGTDINLNTLLKLL